jgi:hypothetical protein
MVCIIHPLYLPSPAKQDWLLVASELETGWNFSNCAGAVDGKHVGIKNPANVWSNFFNCKWTFLIVLLAVIDANYSLVVIDVVGYGKQSDGGTRASLEFGMRLNSYRLDLPKTRVPTGSQTLLPLVSVGHEAVQKHLTKQMTRPYLAKNLCPIERAFNYRLSRARPIRVVGCNTDSSSWTLWILINQNNNAIGCWQSSVVDARRRAPSKCALTVTTKVYADHPLYCNSDTADQLMTPCAVCDVTERPNLLFRHYADNEKRLQYHNG